MLIHKISSTEDRIRWYREIENRQNDWSIDSWSRPYSLCACTNDNKLGADKETDPGDVVSPHQKPLEELAELGEGVSGGKTGRKWGQEKDAEVTSNLGLIKHLSDDHSHWSYHLSGPFYLFLFSFLSWKLNLSWKWKSLNASSVEWATKTTTVEHTHSFVCRISLLEIDWESGPQVQDGWCGSWLCYSS